MTNPSGIYNPHHQELPMTWAQLLFLAAVILIAAFMVQNGLRHYGRLVGAVRDVAASVNSVNFQLTELVPLLQGSAEKSMLLQSWNVDLSEASGFQVLEYGLGENLSEALRELREDVEMREDEESDYRPVKLEMVRQLGDTSDDHFLRLTVAIFDKPEQPANAEGQWCAGGNQGEYNLKEK